MLDFDVSKWPPVYQIFAAFGAAIAGAVVWLIGNRAKGTPGQTSDRTQAKLDTAELRIDLEQVMGASRSAIHKRIDDVRDELKSETDELEKRVRLNEIDIAVLKGRGHR
jgi:hypothetical protein